MKKLLYVILIASMLLLTACSAAPEPVAEPAAEEAAATEEVAAAEEAAASEETAAEAAPVEGELAAPIAYEATKALEGGREAVTFPIDEMITHQSFDEYCEAPYLTKLVEEGKLPPVEERLPAEPVVYKNSFFSDGPGQYGGIFRGVWAVPLEGWNFNAGVILGWFGIEAIVQEEPIATGPMFLTQEVNPIPRLAKSWEWSEDGLTLTMHLVEGIKWSDGVPFTSEDIMFLWEDNIQDPNVVTWTSADYWSIDGQPIQLAALDDFTLEWTFPTPFPTRWLYNMTNNQFSPGPAHILKPFHPKYGGTDYQSYKDALSPNTLPVVALGPWVPVEYKTDEFLVFRRNPYFYMVDENGCQLPYLDEIQFTYSKTGNTRTLNTIAGTADHSNVENIESMDETVRQAADPNATFRVEWGPETLGFDLQFNQAMFTGVQDDRDRAVRDLLINPDFRKAVAYAIDRDGIASSLTNGPFFRSWAGGLFPGSGFFDAESVVYYPYSPESANILLDQIGLLDTNGDGVREWGEGPLAGEEVVLGLEVGEDISAGSTLGPAIIAFMQDVGVKVNFRTIAGTAMTENERAGTWEMRLGRPGQAWSTPNIRCRDIAPATDVFGWHYVGSEPEVYTDFEQRMIEISDEFCAATDFETEQTLMTELNQLFTENVYSLGLATGRYGLMLNENLKNIPIGTPAFLYQWDFNNFLAEQIWLEPEHRTDQGQTEIYPNAVPFYEGCDYATSGTPCVVAPAE